ncbi:MAG: M48 family metallopeptidase [Acidobacteriota bacterium]|jgi:predicted Zn-dependent protease|nr:M48 family metallopeptidase [Acidobacteriota bacterium]NLT32049.1 M48 family metalloprotease [Acidobacteriota bacterium]
MKSLSLKLPVWCLAAVMISSPAAWARKHENVEDIGNRNVTGRVWGVFPNWISLEKEIELGKQVASEFEQTARLVEDPVINEYVDRLGQHIVKHSDAKIPFYIKVVDTDEVNAFAFPGGFFYINKGLILAADNEAELAGVMAHEISHVTARHATVRMSKAQYLQLAAIPALFVGGYWAQMGIQNALGLGINLELMGITRESEREADQLGIQYLWNAGYDPNGFVSFFEKLQRQEKSKPGRLAGFFRTHPSTDDRIVAALDEQRHLPEKDTYIVDSSEFQRIRARLLSIDNAQRAEEAGEELEQKRPTLKRRTEKGEPPPAGAEEGEEPPARSRPTLKRATDPQ